MEHSISDDAFRRGLRRGGVDRYLNTLEKCFETERSCRDRIHEIKDSIDQLKDFAIHRSIDEISLLDLEDCGFPMSKNAQLRQFIRQLDAGAPKLGRMESSGSEHYDDDFEDYDEHHGLGSNIDGTNSGDSKNDGRHYRYGNLRVDSSVDDMDTFSVNVRHNNHVDARNPPTPHAPQSTPHGRGPGLDFKGGGPDFDSPTITNAPRQRGESRSGVRRSGRVPMWIINREWRIGDKIGSGSFGEVFQCLNDYGKLFAVKRLDMLGHLEEVENLANEIQLMRGISHPNIVEYIGASVDVDQGHLYIVQEWVPGGSIASMLEKYGPFRIGVVRHYTRQILIGLQYLHEHNIIHRDIKGGNVLVDDTGTIKLADFGASTTFMESTQKTTNIKGTPFFMAPEVLSKSTYGRKGDVWAVGCTVIQMLTGEPPWKRFNIRGLIPLYLHLEQWTGPPPYEQEVPSEAAEFIDMCFLKDVDDRPSASELLRCAFMSHDCEDALEGSMSGDFNGAEDKHDGLGSSGVIDELKEQMTKAVSASRTSLLHPEDSPTSYINRHLAEQKSPVDGTGAHKAKATSQIPLFSPPINVSPNPFSRNNSRGGLSPADVAPGKRLMPSPSQAQNMHFPPRDQLRTRSDDAIHSPPFDLPKGKAFAKTRVGHDRRGIGMNDLHQMNDGIDGGNDDDDFDDIGEYAHDRGSVGQRDRDSEYSDRDLQQGFDNVRYSDLEGAGSTSHDVHAHAHPGSLHVWEEKHASPDAQRHRESGAKAAAAHANVGGFERTGSSEAMTPRMRRSNSNVLTVGSRASTTGPVTAKMRRTSSRYKNAMGDGDYETEEDRDSASGDRDRDRPSSGLSTGRPVSSDGRQIPRPNSRGNSSGNLHTHGVGVYGSENVSMYNTHVLHSEEQPLPSPATRSEGYTPTQGYAPDGPLGLEPDEDGLGDGSWECLKCHRVNELEDNFCMNCATRKGMRGSRSPNARIPVNMHR